LFACANVFDFIERIEVVVGSSVFDDHLGNGSFKLIQGERVMGFELSLLDQLVMLVLHKDHVSHFEVLGDHFY
jgi:hypothetical protein